MSQCASYIPDPHDEDDHADYRGDSFPANLNRSARRAGKSQRFAACATCGRLIVGSAQHLPTVCQFCEFATREKREPAHALPCPHCGRMVQSDVPTLCENCVNAYHQQAQIDEWRGR